VAWQKGLVAAQSDAGDKTRSDAPGDNREARGAAKDDRRQLHGGRWIARSASQPRIASKLALNLMTVAQRQQSRSAKKHDPLKPKRKEFEAKSRQSKGENHANALQPCWTSL
jgi:hypothetical protein